VKKFRLDKAADADIFVQLFAVASTGKPVRFPGLGKPESKANGMDFLPHPSPLSYDRLGVELCNASRRMILIWLVRFRIGVARPRALGSQRFNVGPGLI
jgi:hypothetical protein